MTFLGAVIAASLIVLAQAFVQDQLKTVPLSGFSFYTNASAPSVLPARFGHTVAIQKASSDSSLWIWVGTKQHACACRTTSPWNCNCLDTTRSKVGVTVKTAGSRVFIGSYDRNGIIYTYTANPGTWSLADFSSVVQFFGGLSGGFLVGKTGITIASGSVGYQCSGSVAQGCSAANKWGTNNANGNGIVLGFTYNPVTNVITPGTEKSDGSVTANYLSAASSYNNDYMGYTVQTDGDVNGDGNQDMIVAVPRSNKQRGDVRVYYGTNAGALSNPTAPISYISKQWGSMFGGSLLAVDIGGDRYAEMIVGAPIYDSLSSYETGAVYIYTGSAVGPVDSTTLCTVAPCSTGTVQILTGTSNAERFGFSLASLGDIDFDGFIDIAVGSPYYSTSTTSNVGKVTLFYGSSSGFLLGQTLIGTATSMLLGYSIWSGYSLDGDSYNDLVCGLPSLQQVVVYSSRSLSNVVLTVTSSPSSGGASLANISATVCATSSGPTTSYGVLVTLTVDSRMAFSNGQLSASQPIYNIANATTKCVTFANISVSVSSSKVTPLLLSASGTNLNATNQQLTITSGSVGVTRCSSGSCDVDLVLSGNYVPTLLVPGGLLTLNFAVSALSGTSAIGVQLTLTWADPLTFIGPVQSDRSIVCLSPVTGNGLVCDLGDFSGSDIVFSIFLLSPTRTLLLNQYADILSFGEASISTLSIDTDATNNQLAINVPLDTSSDLQVVGGVYPSVASYGPKVTINATYTISNPSATSRNVVPNIVVQVLWPIRSLPLFAITVTGSAGTADCSSTAGYVDATRSPYYVAAPVSTYVPASRRRDVGFNITSGVYNSTLFPSFNGSYAQLTCTFSTLGLDQSFAIVFSSIINTTDLNADTVITLPVNISSDTTRNIIWNDINLANNIASPQVLVVSSLKQDTIIPGQSQSVDLWKIIVAAVGGVILIALLLLILFKAGAFKRKPKPPSIEELEADEENAARAPAGPTSDA